METKDHKWHVFVTEGMVARLDQRHKASKGLVGTRSKFFSQYHTDMIGKVSVIRARSRVYVLRQASILLIDDFYRIGSGAIGKAKSSHC
jgi:hypothetical protein